MKKLIILFLSVCVYVTTVSAQAETVGEALKNCGQVQNSLKRLVCYDKIVNQLNRYGGLQDLMQVPAPLPANNQLAAQNSEQNIVLEAKPENATKSQRNAEFGRQAKLPEDTDDKIYATVVEVTKDGLKRAVFKLDNGHIWREQEATNFKVKVNEVIYIERGALGSYHLGKDSQNRRIRVKRIN
ncbi:MULTISPECIES: hypothetical protein [Alteromonadaceae]|uniref:hypothetical protein n=1 Tax=Alteromonadaceae TaxID=72275 RepID=UPI001C089D2C|nr:MULTISPECIES: hypothetical protein [Aliiglaciecola]MBU2878840.1 hypothetical protein [Aliiglaciecola lipolytica]MDO6711261.1 hypothetical protein [Aliiglaciecola sp. 2_MG-2023]MDO6752290.1 hypothetical protein [Aliiglaciecola sp. 1_MG-2023]